MRRRDLSWANVAALVPVSLVVMVVTETFHKLSTNHKPTCTPAQKLHGLRGQSSERMSSPEQREHPLLSGTNILRSDLIVV